MNTVQKLFKNTGLLFLAQMVNYILGFFYVMYSARYLGAEGFGILSFALAFASIFSMFVDLGLSTLTVREVSREKNLATQYFSNIIVIKIILALLTFGSIFIIINLIQYNQITLFVVYIITISIIFNSFSQFLNSIFQAFEKMEYQSISTILTGILMFIGILFAIMQDYTVYGFAMVYLIVSFVIFIYSLIIALWKFTKLKFQIDNVFWKKSIKKAIPLSFYAVFLFIAFKIDIVLLSILKSNIEVGWYSASYRLIEALMFIPAVVSVSLLPLFSKFHINSKESLKKAYIHSLVILILIGIPISFGGALLSNDIILLVYKSGYYQSILALEILIWAIPLVFANYIFRTLLIAIDKQNILLKIVFVMVLLNISLNIVLIPLFGYIGASIVTIMTELLSFLLAFYYISKYVVPISLFKILSKSLVSSIVMSIFIKFTAFNILITIIFSIIIYFVMLLILRTFEKEDYILFKKLIKLQ